MPQQKLGVNQGTDKRLFLNQILPNIKFGKKYSKSCPKKPLLFGKKFKKMYW